MPNTPTVTFNGGEYGPHIDARSDTEKYSSGCRHLENMLPKNTGAAVKRPGTKLISTAIAYDDGLYGMGIYPGS